MAKHDPLRAALEIREQLASEKRRLAFFFGAGTSMAVGLPGIIELTNKVSEQLQEPYKKQFETIKKELPDGSNVENVLDQIRLCREFIGDNEKKEFDCFKGASSARNLDSTICRAICDIVSGNPPGELKPHLTFAQWLQALYTNRDWPVEVFTINYDLLLERAMEASNVPFFDGFIGSVAPFFVPESVEAEGGKTNDHTCPPMAWTRLWKLHGSINWCLRKDPLNNRERITRFSGSDTKTGEELVIFPSREKYTQSRKLPFLAYQDRFRKFLSIGESLVIVVGYRFSDEHLNDIMFQGLRSNPRLAIVAFMHSELSKEIIQYGTEYTGISFYGPDKVCIGGEVAPWGEPGRKQRETENWPFWNSTSKHFTLGDFNSFAHFLKLFIGLRPSPATSEKEDSENRDTEKQTKNDSKT